MTDRRVPLVTTTGHEAGEAEVILHSENRRCRLQLRLGTDEFSGEGSDYFEALCQVRRQLEQRGLLVRVYGGSRNVILSGMCRDQASGLTGYRVSLGKPSQPTDRVAIFDTGPDVEPVTVDEQQAFYDEWLRGLRAKAAATGPQRTCRRVM